MVALPVSYVKRIPIIIPFDESLLKYYLLLRQKGYDVDMPRFKFNKLVRDKIVEHQIKSGAKPKFRYLTKDEHKNQLIHKLIEEAREVLDAEEKDVATEIADVKQALDDLIEQYSLSETDIKAHQDKKRKLNGAFKKGIYVDYVELEEDDPFTDYYRNNSDRYPEISETK